MSEFGSPVEEYLDLLYAKLRTTPRKGRRLLAEAEDHLRQAVAEAVAAGMSQHEAEEHAISAFGSVRAVVRAHQARGQRFPAVAVVRDLIMSGWLLGAVGLLAIGASGLVAAAMNHLFGREFVGGTPTAAGLNAAACQHYLANWPAARGCAQAAMMEISADAVSLRVLAGLAGIIVLGGYLFARRWRSRTLPDGFVPTVAVTLFGAAAAGLAFLAVNRHGAGGGIGGPGAYLSGAIVALLVALAFIPPLQRTLLRNARD